MQGYAELLDAASNSKHYSASLAKQKVAIDNPDCTPSARMLDEMSQKGEGFYQFAMRMSQQHHKTFVQKELSQEESSFYQDLSRSSLERQHQIEASDSLPFATFLERYFNKSLRD